METDWAIDKDAYSGRFDAVSFLDFTSYQQANKPENPASRPNILSILPTIQEIENLYYQYIFASEDDVVFPPSSLDIALGTLRFMRYYVYNGVQWFGTTFALSDPGFVNYVSNNSPEVFNTMFEYISTSKLLTDNANGQVELPHLSVTTECYISASIIPDFWAGWGGDLASVMPEVASESSLDYFQTACSKVGADNCMALWWPLGNGIDSAYRRRC